VKGKKQAGSGEVKIYPSGGGRLTEPTRKGERISEGKKKKEKAQGGGPTPE